MQCEKPIRLSVKHDYDIVVPCGRCRSCRIAYSRTWSARLLHELHYWNDSVFATLTYDDEHLPENGSLVKGDLQKFFKRLRKNNRLEKNLRYFACGEYGDKSGRPHYHAIIYGLGFKDREMIKDAWRQCVWYPRLDRKRFGTVTYDSCRYVSDYVFKKYSGVKNSEVYTSKGLETPFRLCSKGLGLRWAQDNKDQLERQGGFTLRGIPVQVPRYYVKKLDLNLKQVDNDDVWLKYMRSQNYELYLHYRKWQEKQRYDMCDYILDQFKQLSADQRALNVAARTSLRQKGSF